MLELEVNTRVMGTSRPPLTFIVAFPGTHIPLSELIAQRVRTEIEREHPKKEAARPLSLRYLTDENLPSTLAGAAELPCPILPLALQQKLTRIVKQHQRLRAQQREDARQAEHLFQTLPHHSFSDEQ